MSKEEALQRMSSRQPRRDSILESQDQDGHYSIRQRKLIHLLGMTGIDMALSSGYKTLASKLANWTYLDTRTLVFDSFPQSPHLIAF